MIKFSKSTGWFYDTRHGYASIPIDAVEITEEERDALLIGERAGKRISSDSNGNPVLVGPPEPTQLEIQESKAVVVQRHLDNTARIFQYDDIKDAITYAEEPSVPKFQSEGQAFRAWRSMVWAKHYAILSDVADGLREMPTDEELILELPELDI